MISALSLVLMMLTTLIPVGTYALPIISGILLVAILIEFNTKWAFAVYFVVSVLSFLLSGDKEAALYFVMFFGYYPILKPVVERSKLTFVLKLLYFNSSILAAYAIMIRLLGMQEIAVENAELGMIGLATIIILGNVTFLLLDRLLSIMEARFR